MYAVVLDAGNPETLAPLTCSRPLAEIPVANLPLLRAQHRRLEMAGLSVQAPPPDGALRLTQAGDAWLSVAMLRQLSTTARPVCVQDERGRALAWVSSSEAVPTPSRTIAADDGSYSLAYPWDLLRVNEELVGALSANQIEGSLSKDAVIDGTLVLGKGSRVLPGVYIEGNVVIGRDCKVGPNCYLRGNTSVGDGCHLGQAVEVKNSIVMAHTSIGHLSYCGDSIVGEGVNLGAGTITANLRHDGKNSFSALRGALVDTGRRKLGAVIGDQVHTGIHTSIYPGRKIWPGLWTRPGAIVRADIEHQEDPASR
jgi:NDP-sugar pyrophosphorylase family protein